MRHPLVHVPPMLPFCMLVMQACKGHTHISQCVRTPLGLCRGLHLFGRMPSFGTDIVLAAAVVRVYV